MFHFQLAVFRVEEEADGKQADQEDEAQDGQEGDFASLPCRFVEGTYTTGNGQPAKHEERGQDDGIGPIELGPIATAIDHVEDYPSQDPDTKEKQCKADGAAVRRAEPFQTRQAQPLQRRELLLESVVLGEVHQAGGEADEDRHRGEHE